MISRFMVVQWRDGWVIKAVYLTQPPGTSRMEDVVVIRKVPFEQALSIRDALHDVYARGVNHGRSETAVSVDGVAEPSAESVLETSE